ACLTAACQRGFPRAADISSGLEIGFGPTDLTIIGGKRESAADAYLIPALGRPNLRIIANAGGRALLLDDGRCTGIEYRQGAAQSVIKRAGTVVLAAGTIGSAQLLMLSGIGPSQHLRSVGVDVVHELPGVGSNLQDHPLTGVIYRARRSV